MADPENKYKEIGFMCGLEIHQRLATDTKLFCSCPANVTEAEKINAKVSRYQRAVAGELGQIDPSAQFEGSKSRKFVYNVVNKNACLVELDEEPPHEMNREALQLALSFAEAMGMRPINEIQPMRKEVVDGSDPSAFQRTSLIAVDGRIKVDSHVINIPTIFLEEESSGIISNSGNEITYDISRLGIPLVEIDTDPYIPTPEIAKKVALHIGTMLRVSGKVQRGIGSIRQDVNISIKGGARVEIKGLQELDTLDKFIENEVIRQQKLLGIRDELKRRNASVSSAAVLTEIFKLHTGKIIKSQLDKQGVVIGFGLKGFQGVLGAEINPERRLGSEISDYAKMAGVNGIIHSDEMLHGYGISDEEVSAVRKSLYLDQEDAFVLIAGGKGQAEKAATFAIGRARHALIGIPLETRGTLNTDKFTTRFLRPLPGGARMYPETDMKPILITPKMIKAAKESAPDADKMRKKLSKLLSDQQLAERLLTSPKLGLFMSLSTKGDPNIVANVLLQKFVELKRAGFDADSIGEERLSSMFDLYFKGDITKQALDEILKELSKKDADVQTIIKRLSLRRVTGKELKKLVEEAKAKTHGNSDIARKELMSKYRLVIDGQELNNMLKSA
jgi:glutamyl-tRNA(Gln) amidotransferase subunit E